MFIKIILIEAVIIFAFAVCLKLFFDKRKQKTIIQNLEFHNKILKNIYDEIRCVKHDFSNFIQALDGYIKCNDMDGIKSLVYPLYKEIKSINNQETFNPEIINNPAVYNLILNKYNCSLNNNIEFNIEVNLDFSNINIDTYNLCRILGILLDNAIEAAKRSEERIINIRFQNGLDYKLLIVENSYDKHDIDISKIFEKGYSKKDSKEGHGLGLWKVKKIIDNSENLELKTYKSSLFVQELKIINSSENFTVERISDKVVLN